MPAPAFKGRVVRMLDIYLWFFAGLAMGLCVMGFIAIASYDRGVDSVRRRRWSMEIAARHAVVARRGGRLAPAALRPSERHPIAS